MNEKPASDQSPKPLLSWTEYCTLQYQKDPHGISPESKEVDEATRGSWDAFWRWSDGSGVGGIIYSNYGAAIKAARKYGFELPSQNIANHERLKAAMTTGERAFGHAFSFRHSAPRDTVQDTMMAKKKQEESPE